MHSFALKLRFANKPYPDELNRERSVISSSTSSFGKLSLWSESFSISCCSWLFWIELGALHGEYVCHGNRASHSRALLTVFILLGEEVLVSFSPPPRYLLVWKFVTNFPNDGCSSFDVFWYYYVTWSSWIVGFNHRDCGCKQTWFS